MLDLADATDATVPLLVAFVCEPSTPIELPLAVLEAPIFEVRLAADDDVDDFCKPANEGFFALGIGGFSLDEVEACCAAAVLEAGFAGTGRAEGAGVGAPAPRFHTLLTMDLAAEDKNPNLEGAAFWTRFSVDRITVSEQSTTS